VSDFAWSPSNNVLAYFVPEEVTLCACVRACTWQAHAHTSQGARAARAAVVEWPSRSTLRSKNLFNVNEVGASVCTRVTCARVCVGYAALADEWHVPVRQGRAQQNKEDDVRARLCR
jgi:uncharacterized protein with WD repeat